MDISKHTLGQFPSTFRAITITKKKHVRYSKTHRRWKKVPIAISVKMHDLSILFACFLQITVNRIVKWYQAVSRKIFICQIYIKIHFAPFDWLIIKICQFLFVATERFFNVSLRREYYRHHEHLSLGPRRQLRKSGEPQR